MITILLGFRKGDLLFKAFKSGGFNVISNTLGFLILF